MEEEINTHPYIEAEKMSNSYFQAIFDNAGVGIVVLDLERRIIRSNKAFQKMLNFDEYELSNISIKEITHPDDIGKDTDLFQDIVEGKLKDYTCEKRYISKGKSIVHARVTFSSTSVDSNLENKSILTIVEDISKQKQLEKKFAEEQNLLSVLLEHIPDSIYFKDIGSHFIKVSYALASKHGKVPEQLIGKTDFDLYGLYHASEAFKDEQEIINSGKPIISKEEKEDHIDGRTTWSSSTKMPLYDNSKKIIGTFGISRDITFRKKSEEIKEALFQISEAVFTASDMNTLFTKIHEMISTLMPVKNLLIALYNEQKDTLHFPYFVDQYDSVKKERKLQKGIAEFIIERGEGTLLHESDFLQLLQDNKIDKKETFPQICLGVPLKLDSNIIGALVIKDYENPKAYKDSDLQILTFVAEQIAQVIERKKNAEEIKRYTEQLKHLNATKDKFFSIIAHDLRNPFITILGFSDLLLTDYQELSDEERLYYIQEMKKSSEISHNLLQNLLQWSRSQTGKIDFHPEQLNLTNMICENFELLQLSADRKNISLINEITKTVLVLADEDMVNTVIRNLLSNAIKFTPKNGIINISCKEEESMLRVLIKDNGVGMTEEIKKNIFRIDISHSTIGTENEAGTGLGLILCKEFIEKNGGNIFVNSELGKGSTFSFTLPLFGKQ
jgi:PAS domain S-box-containing protein